MNTRNSLILVSIFASATAGAATPPDNVRNFVSCPIVRDTTTVPCWLSEYEGELYYLGIQTDISSDFHPPYLGHQVIVEGTVTDQPRICGGIVLDPVKISVVAELDRNCNTILPVDDRYVVDFNPRPPGPSGGRLAFQQPAAVSQPADAPAPDEFRIHYYFDGKVEGRNGRDLSRILNYARSTEASRIQIIAYQGSLLLSDGTLLNEKAGLAEQRAREVRALLSGAGLDVDYDLEWREAPVADGVADWNDRRTEVLVLP